MPVLIQSDYSAHAFVIRPKLFRFGRIMEILYGAKNGVHAFSYNSADWKWTELDEIWSTVSTLFGLALADFGRD